MGGPWQVARWRATLRIRSGNVGPGLPTPPRTGYRIRERRRARTTAGRETPNAVPLRESADFRSSWFVEDSAKKMLLTI